MNPRLQALHPYPFEKLRHLTANIQPASLPSIAWSIGEPKHSAPSFFRQ